MGSKTILWTLQATNKQNLTRENMAKKVNLQKETESLLIAAQNNTIRTNYIKARIDKTLQNSKCRLCSDRDETINHIISECSKLVQREYKSRHNWVGKIILWELCKKFKFDYVNKGYMHNPEPVLENETHKILWNFNTNESPNLNQMTRASDNQQKNRELVSLWTLCPGWPQSKIKGRQKER